MVTSSPGLPELFVGRLRLIFPGEIYPDVEETFHHPKRTTFRLNRLKGGDLESIRRLREAGITVYPLDGMQGVWSVLPEDRRALLNSEPAANGRLYVQNASSMIPPVILDPQPYEQILDLTAAPGSKTLQIAEMMENRGRLAAVEKVRKRFYKLKENLSHNGASVAEPVLANGENCWRYYPGIFDRVLLDAPCSTEGRFLASDPDTYRFWSMRKIKEMVRKQNRLLFSAVQCLKPGGTIVYSTCTFAPEENEGVIDRILQRFQGTLQLEEMELPGNIRWLPGMKGWKHKQFDASLNKARRIIPDAIHEGFFICKIRKTGN